MLSDKTRELESLLIANGYAVMRITATRPDKSPSIYHEVMLASPLPEQESADSTRENGLSG
jgi:hypothetical protein